jgi:hypothetical protein
MYWNKVVSPVSWTILLCAISNVVVVAAEMSKLVGKSTMLLGEVYD